MVTYFTAEVNTYIGRQKMMISWYHQVQNSSMNIKLTRASPTQEVEGFRWRKLRATLALLLQRRKQQEPPWCVV